MDDTRVTTNGAEPSSNGGEAAIAAPVLAEPQPPPTVEAIPKPRSVVSKKRRGRARKAKRKSPVSRNHPEAKARRTFPASTFGDALVIAQAIQQFASGQRIRRLTLFENINKSPDSGPSRQLVTNSSKYGLTKGSYKSEWLELTPDGAVATDPDARRSDQLRARFKLAIEKIPPFLSLYQQYKGNKLPSLSVMRDHLTEQNFPAAEVNECVDTFILNAKELGLLRMIAGAERILPIDQVVEDLPAQQPTASSHSEPGSGSADGGSGTNDSADWSKICFYVTPIGEPDSEERRHSDLFLSSIVEPAMVEFGLRVVRADHIGKPGMISQQVIQHVINAKLVIADLSFHNPNVFYELCLRHASRKPTVQLIRAADPIPFDLDQFRTITIDTTDIYTLVPQLETYRSEIASHARRALTDPDAVDNPLTVFCPGLSLFIPLGAAAG